MKKIFAVSGLLISISVATSSVAISGATPVIKFDWERAVSLYKQGQFREAIAEFRKVLDEAPDHSDSWKFIGLSYYQLKDYKSAIQPLEKALELKRKDNRNDPDLYRALGQSHMLLKDYDKALPYFETLVRVQMNVAVNFYLRCSGCWPNPCCGRARTRATRRKPVRTSRRRPAWRPA